MKSFLYLTLFCTLALGLTIEFKLNKVPSKGATIPFALNTYQESIKSHFKKPENANLLMAFLFGAKQGISPHTKKAFEKNNLSFLLSPSGIHLSSLFLIISFFLKRWLSKEKRKWTTVILLSFLFLLPTPENIKRLSLLRLGFHGKQFFKKRITALHLLYLVFALSFLLGHYFDNPLSYLMSLLYIGTFFTLSEQSRMTLFLGLFSNLILMALFLGNKISLFSVLTSIAGVAIFTFLQPIFILYFLSFWIYPTNYVEPLINYYVQGLKITSKAINGTFTSSSIFLLLAIWTLLFLKKKRCYYFLFTVLLLLHCNTSMTPCFFTR